MTFACELFIWFMLYSVIGWVYESILCSVIQKRFVNRGFLNGPYCPIYGAGGIINILVLGRIHDYILMFFAAALLTSILEYLTSWVMEKLFHARWWDYSDQKLNLNGRIFLPGAIAFGAFSVVQLVFIQPSFAAFTAAMPAALLSAIALMLLMMFVTDTVYTVTKMYEFNELLRDAAGHLDEALQSVKTLYDTANENYRDKLVVINTQIRRTLRSFPKLKSTHYNDRLKKLKEFISRDKNSSL
jgi:Predicted membrane protein